MSYGIVRIQKFGSGSVKGIEIHECRKKDVSHTNKDIDWERTGDNYDLHPEQNRNFNRAVKQRIGKLNLKKAVRKDAVVMAQVLVTSDHIFFETLSKQQQEQFFKDSYDFLAERYGKENIISSTVHLDERTPHMHFNFVPVTADGRLSAKIVFTRQNLIEQQTAFYEQVGKKYGLERGIEGRKVKHLETHEFKARTATQLVENATQRAKQLEADIQSLEDTKHGLERKLEALAEKLQNTAQVVELEQKGKRTLTGGLKGITFREFEDLVKTAKKVDEMQGKIKIAIEKVQQANQIAEQARKDRPSIKAQVEIAQLKSENKNLKDLLNKVQRVDPDLYKKIIQQEQRKTNLER